MGDTGAMAIGGLVAAMAMATRTVLLLPIIGGLFVIITMSLVIQRISYKTTGKRVFLNSPLHHHFELKGWSEVNVVIRFWIIAGMVAAIGWASSTATSWPRRVDRLWSTGSSPPATERRSVRELAATQRGAGCPTSTGPGWGGVDTRTRTSTTTGTVPGWPN